MADSAKLEVTFDRSPGLGRHPFLAVFMGFGNVPAVRGVLGRATETILSGLGVDVQDTGAYLHVDDDAGTIVVDRAYLRSAAEVYLYLDVIHELVHIRQLNQGLDLFDHNYSYVERPTELEAYRVGVKEARRIGLSDEEIAAYLKVEWLSEHDFGRFLEILGIRP